MSMEGAERARGAVVGGGDELKRRSREAGRCERDEVMKL